MPPVSHERIDAAIRHVQENFSQPLSLEKLARQFFISAFHFHRLFRAVTGQTVADFIEAQRLAQACYLLRHGARGMSDIARACGWKNQSTMNRAFVRRLRCTPSQVRAGKRLPKATAAHEQISLPRLDVRLVQWPELHALACAPGKAKRSLAARWRALIDAGLSARLFGLTTPRVIAYYQTASLLRRNSYSLALEGSARAPFVSVRFPAGRYLVGEYTGSARFLPPLYDLLYQRVLQHNLDLAPRSPFEIFEQYPPFVTEQKSRIVLAIPLEK